VSGPLSCSFWDKLAIMLPLLLIALQAAAQANAPAPEFKVVHKGRFADGAKDVTFPKRGAAAVVFGESILETADREDGYLDLARSKDGRRLWFRRGTDDGDERRSSFEVAAGAPLPDGAVLQLVDGFTSPADPASVGGLGSTSFQRGAKVLQTHVEAWLALPRQQQIVRPADGARFPLIPASGAADAAKAAKAQWVVFVSRCKESKGPCVYYGPPALTCARSTEARESDALQIHPRKCPSLPSS
jgi:hypothetical protein